MKTVFGGKMRRVLLSTVVLLAFPAGQAAAGPYVVDSAEIGEVGECSFDLWHTHGRRGVSETAAAAYCVVLPGFEVGVSGSGFREGSTSFSAGVEAKAALIEPQVGQFGVAIGGGLGYGLSEREFEGAYVNLPVTFMPAEPVRLNANVGWEWDHPDRRHNLTYGVGAEIEAHPRVSLIGEVFGSTDGSLGLQAGVRPVIVPDRLHLDLVYGRSLKGAADHSVTLGVGFAF